MLCYLLYAQLPAQSRCLINVLKISKRPEVKKEKCPMFLTFSFHHMTILCKNFLNSNVINHPTSPPSNISGEKRGEQEERKNIYTKCTVFWIQSLRSVERKQTLGENTWICNSIFFFFFKQCIPRGNVCKQITFTLIYNVFSYAKCWV